MVPPAVALTPAVETVLGGACGGSGGGGVNMKSRWEAEARPKGNLYGEDCMENASLHAS